MDLNLNAQSDTALYIQIYQAVKQLIVVGKLKPGQKLPSRRQLALQNHVSTATVLTAYDQLLTEGYIISRPRSGYYVANIQLQFPEIDPVRQTVDPPAEKDQIDLIKSTPDETLFPYIDWQQAYQTVLSSQNRDILDTTSGAGHPRLQQAIADYLSTTRGVACTYDQIVLGPSSRTLVQHLLTIIDHNGIIAIENPGYQGFNFLTQFGYTIVPVNIDDDGIQVEAVEDSRASVVIVTPNHQFPTGTIMPISRRQDLLIWSTAEPSRYIIENDYDGEFKYEGQPVPGLTHLDRDQRVIHIGSFSRNLAPGIRVSYMVVPHSIKKQVVPYFNGKINGVNSLTQLALAEFIQSGDLVKHLNHSRTFYRKKRNHLIGCIQQRDPEAEILGESAGLSLLFKPSLAFDAAELKKNCAKNGIVLTTLSDYTQDSTFNQEPFIYFSFSNIPFDVLEEVINQIYACI